MVKRPAFYHSSLEAHPDLVKALGMLSIEISNLESYLCAMLQHMLECDYELAMGIFFAPKQSIARLDVISNVAAIQLRHHPSHLAGARTVLKRARARFERRHELVHAWWTVEWGTDDVYHEQRPNGPANKITSAEVNHAVTKTRDTIQNINRFCDSLIGLRSSQRKSLAPFPPKKAES